MIDTAVIRLLCEAHPSFGASVVNGLLAWAGMLGANIAFWSALPAAVALFIPSRPVSLARRIDWGLGIGLIAGTGLGFPLFILFVARIAS